jgi:preprotein translocase subunit SecG
MTNFVSVWQGFVIMVVCIIIGILMSFAGGTALESILDGYAQAGVYDVPAEWDTMGEINLLVNIYYLMMYLFPVVGIACFVVSVLKRQKYDRYYPYQEEW